MNYKMTRAKGKSKILFNCSIVEWPDGYQVDADNFEMHVTFTLIEGPEDL